MQHCCIYFYLCLVNSTDYIRSKGLKVTPVRLKVLDELQQTHLAMTHTELEATFSKVDRITLYRVLKDFEEAGIVHKIVGGDGVTRFAVCNHDCPGSTHTDDHVHFNCTQCQKMFCLEHTHVPLVKLPTGFTIVSVNTLVQGVCKNCA